MKTRRTWGYDRTSIVPVRFSAEEKRRVRAKANAAGMPLSTFIREVALCGSSGGGAAVESLALRALRHRLRQVHTGLQQALLHAQTDAGTEHLRRAMALLDDTIDEFSQYGGTS